MQPSARDKIRAFFESRVGQVVTTHEIAEIAGIKDYPRRIRELRNEEGMQISSYRDRVDLKPDEYVLETLQLLPAIARNISEKTRAEILERNGFTCQMCGAGAGDPDPYNPLRKVRLVIDHRIPISQGGTDDPDNLQAVCNNCNAGRANIYMPSEDAKGLLARIRRSPRNVRREVYEALKRSFGED
ncbi:MAG TPA: HNH endonuclease signature motif containing protein [Chloroflexia bacterium]